jgi:hypothetical protein
VSIDNGGIDNFGSRALHMDEERRIRDRVESLEVENAKLKKDNEEYDASNEMIIDSAVRLTIENAELKKQLEHYKKIDEINRKGGMAYLNRMKELERKVSDLIASLALANARVAVLADYVKQHQRPMNTIDECLCGVVDDVPVFGETLTYNALTGKMVRRIADAYGWVSVLQFQIELTKDILSIVAGRDPTRH